MAKYEKIGFIGRFERAKRGPADCWIWDGATVAKKRYGVFRTSDGRFHLAHRAAYELMVGPIPEGFDLDHTCNNPPCCNPAHLEPVTHAENMRRYGVRRTECRRGHDLTPENTFIRANGGRECRICRAVWITRQNAR